MDNEFIDSNNMRFLVFNRAVGAFISYFGNQPFMKPPKFVKVVSISKISDYIKPQIMKIKFIDGMRNYNLIMPYSNNDAGTESSGSMALNLMYEMSGDFSATTDGTAYSGVNGGYEILYNMATAPILGVVIIIAEFIF